MAKFPLLIAIPGIYTLPTLPLALPCILLSILHATYMALLATAYIGLSLVVNKAIIKKWPFLSPLANSDILKDVEQILDGVLQLLTTPLLLVRIPAKE